MQYGILYAPSSTITFQGRGLLHLMKSVHSAKGEPAMQEPADSVLATAHVETVIESSQSAIALDQAQVPGIAPSLEEGEAPTTDEPLNLLERIAANCGAWIITLVERWHLQSGPSLIVDGHPIGDLLASASSSRETAPPPPSTDVDGK